VAVKEKLKKYALLAEIIGGISIVASLLFVGYQIQLNSEALLAGSRQNLLEADLQVLDNLMDYPQLYDVPNQDDFTGEDWLRLRIHYVSMMQIREYAWQQFNNGVLDERTFNAYLEPLKFVFNSENGREFLLNGDFSGDLEFEQYVVEYLGLDN
jgi:hypothetical protein